ncbi:class I SAM-dependent methyltransferase [Flavihumibacter profundi]|uniref:class I SAM-dependent methyltransferase n=1 Tax=Flavihumibacter profundi TaxID=2716883 RepID=UPI001CC360D3|nr:class I SAM-dependent methyltransferase [Flavihumibacter profundi]MBZ5859151.1 class I SAM-dependent methyltransferase [Flavihumibacter profundi]
MIMPDKIISQNDPVGASTLMVIASAKKFNRWMYAVIKPYITGRVLEIGSGIGNISSYLLTDNQQVTLSDLNSDYCSHLKTRFADNPSLEDVLSLDLVAPDFATSNAHLLEKFNTIVLLNVIEHIEDHERAIRNAGSLLVANGRLILLAPAYPFLFTAIDAGLGHFRRYTKSTMRSLLRENGFNIKHWLFFNFTGIAGWFVFGKILSRKALESGEMTIYEALVPLNKAIDRVTHKIAGLSIIFIGEKKG